MRRRLDHHCSDTELIINCVAVLVVDTSLDHGTIDTKSKDVNGACDKRTHHPTLAHKNSVGDGKPRQVVNTNHAVSSTNDTKALINRPNTTEECQNKYINVKGKWPRCTCIVKKKARNTDEPLARICAATGITSTDLPVQNLYVVKYTMRTTEDTLVETLTHSQRLDENKNNSIYAAQSQTNNASCDVWRGETCRAPRKVACHSALLLGLLQHDRSTAGEDSNVETKHCFLCTTTRINLFHGTPRNQQT